MPMSDQRGFTLIELVMAMAVFSFMLLIIMEGFTQIIQLHNGAIEENAAQDNARGAMDTIVADIRGASSVSVPTPNTLCILSAAGGWQYFAVVTTAGSKILYESDDCLNINSNKVALTSSIVQVANFQAAVETAGVTEPEVSATITVASNNNTTFGSGAATQCKNNDQDREFCSVVTLNSGAVPR
jgi:prepilin-type N-terminal cleavage/methylation domain-containing protein